MLKKANNPMMGWIALAMSLALFSLGGSVSVFAEQQVGNTQQGSPTNETNASLALAYEHSAVIGAEQYSYHFRSASDVTLASNPDHAFEISLGQDGPQVSNAAYTWGLRFAGYSADAVVYTPAISATQTDANRVSLNRGDLS